MNRPVQPFLYKILILAVWGFCTAGPLPGQIDPALDARLERRMHVFGQTALPYRLYIPEGYNPSDPLPLLLFLHGARWSGSDNVSQLDNVFAVYWVQDSVQANQPFFTVFPQCPSGKSWESVTGQAAEFPPDPEMETLEDLLDSLIREFAVDTSRLYLAGKSMGGQGVYGMLARSSHRFAAAVIVAGPLVYRDISELSRTPLWLLHAREDNTVPVTQSRDAVQRLEQSGEQVVLTHCDFHTGFCGIPSHAFIDQAIDSGTRFFYSEFDTSGHQVEPKVVHTYGLHQWVSRQRRNSTRVQPLTPECCVPATVRPNPFNSQTTIHYSLSASCRVKVILRNVCGYEVMRIPEMIQPAGMHEIRIEAGRLESGIYLAVIQAGNMKGSVKMILIK